MKAALKLLIRVYMLKKEKEHSYLKQSEDTTITRLHQNTIDRYNEMLDDIKAILNDETS